MEPFAFLEFRRFRALRPSLSNCSGSRSKSFDEGAGVASSFRYRSWAESER